MNDAAVLFRSWVFSGTLGLLWVLLVQFGPLTALEHLLPPEDRPVSITFMPPPVENLMPVKSATLGHRQQRAMGGGTAFGGSAPVGDVTGLLRGIVMATNGNINAIGGKAVLAYGEGGQGSRTPGTVSMGDGAGDLGTVSGESGFGHEGTVVGGIGIRESRISGPKGDASELGSAVRSHASQLRFCYVEEGLKVNPGLAGSVVLVLTLDDGIVTVARIGHRTWAGADEVEACILQKAQAWHMPSGSGTFEFSLNFTK